MNEEIIILSGNYKAKANKLLIAEIEQRGYKARVLNPAKLHLYLSDRNGWDLIYDNYTKKPERLHTGNIKAVVPRLGTDLSYNSFIINQFTNNLGIYSLQSADAILTASNKMKTLQKCSSKALRIPKTIFAKDDVDIDFVVSKLGLPFVCKTVSGSLGVGVFIVESKLSALGILQTLFKQKQALILQEFVGNGMDIRAVVIGNKVVAAEKRKTNKRNEFRANLSLGGKGTAIELDAQTQEFCVRAAKAVGLEVAGVDIMFNRNNEPILIEVNANFGFKIQDITGINIAGTMIDYLIENMDKKKPVRQEIRNIIESEYFSELFEKSKGKTVKYRDRNQKRKRVKINALSDIYNIMIDTFKII